MKLPRALTNEQMHVGCLYVAHNMYSSPYGRREWSEEEDRDTPASCLSPRMDRIILTQRCKLDSFPKC